ncbi:MAG TPA: SDR family oxidoreductase [Anaeromyxobacter sp.]|nr:SDR family oxidoreductase [Anaeromyxobacter sp.]
MSAVEKVVVFGATSAMAQQAVRLLAREGAELVLVGRDPEKLAAVSADAVLRGARSAARIPADLDDCSRFDELAGDVFGRLGRVDLVLLAQGLLGDTPACERDPALAARVLHTNLVAPALLLERVAARMAGQGSGTIVGISSVAGDRGRQSNYVYGAAKGGLSLYLSGLRNRLARSGVHVVTVKPGLVDTPMTAAMPRSRLFSHPSTVAVAILRAVRHRSDEVYVPGYWRAVMWIVRHVPERMFKRMRL